MKNAKFVGMDQITCKNSNKSLYNHFIIGLTKIPITHRTCINRLTKTPANFKIGPTKIPTLVTV